MWIKVAIALCLICTLAPLEAYSQDTCEPNFLAYRRFKFSSPEYPREYPNNTRCSYYILAPEFHYITITFHDFQLYDENDYIEFVEEYEENWARRTKRGISISSVSEKGAPVQIQRGGDSKDVETTSSNYGEWAEESTKVIRKVIKGPQKTPFKYVTERNVVSITFVSDGSYSAKGFNATYSAIRYRKRCVPKIFTENEGTIVNHRSPAGFPPNAKCKYVIRAKKGNFIEVDFAPSLPFNFYDSIEIQTKIGKQLLTHKMDALAFKLNITNNVVSIRYISDARTMGGFSIKYRVFSADEICKGKEMKGMEGSFHSPGYPTLYPFGLDCQYTIEVEPGYHVEITFDALFLSIDGVNRTGDYIEITDNGGGEDEEKVVYDRTRYTPLKYVSQSNSVGVSFFSDSAKLWKERGFSATYKAMKDIKCGSDAFVVACGKFNCTYGSSGEVETCHVECDENYKRSGKKIVKCEKATADNLPKCVLDPKPFYTCLKNIRSPDCPHSYERVADYFTDRDEEGRIDFPRDEVFASKADINSKEFSNYIRRAMENRKESCDHRLCSLNSMTNVFTFNCQKYAGEKTVFKKYKKSGTSLRAKNRHLRHCLKCQYLNCRSRG